MNAHAKCYCGGNGMLCHVGMSLHIECTSCHASGSNADTEEAAWAAWDALAEVVEAARAVAGSPTELTADLSKCLVDEPLIYVLHGAVAKLDAVVRGE